MKKKLCTADHMIVPMGPTPNKNPSFVGAVFKSPPDIFFLMEMNGNEMK